MSLVIHLMTYLTLVASSAIQRDPSTGCTIIPTRVLPLKAGQAATLSDDNTKYPKQTTTWTKDGEWFHEVDWPLVLRNVSPKDSGSYRCKLNTFHGCNEYCFQLTVGNLHERTIRITPPQLEYFSGDDETYWTLEMIALHVMLAVAGFFSSVLVILCLMVAWQKIKGPPPPEVVDNTRNLEELASRRRRRAKNIYVLA